MVCRPIAQNACEQTYQGSTPTLTDRIGAAALALGFCRVGFCAVDPLTREAAALRDWLNHDRHGGVAFMQAHGRRDAPEMPT